MMKRYLLSIILGFFAMANSSIGQLEIIFSEETANVGGTVDVDVTVNGFTDISVLQFSGGWDSLVMNFNSVVFTNPDLPDLSATNISGPEGASNVNPGQFSFSYGSPTGDGNLPDGAILFTIRYDIVGEECDETSVILTEDPAPIEAFNANFDELTVTTQDGSVMVNGSDCGGGGGDELTITAPMLNADMGANICIPLTVENFIGVQAGSGTILWDPTVLSYTGLANINITGVNGSLNDTNVENGELLFVWSNPDPANPLSIADGEPIFEICFDVIGEVGDMSPITLSPDGNLGFEWTDDNDEVIPQLLVDGKVTVTETVEDPFTINVSDITVAEDDTNVCVDFSVENFTDILSMQFVITWDGTLLSNATPDNFNLTGLTASSSFNVDGDCATVSWSGPVGTTVPDGTQIFSMCFDVIGDCDNTSTIDIVSKGSTNIEIIDGNTNEVPGVSINPGSVEIDCDPPACTVVSFNNTCIGELGGNITVDVPTEGCTYSWADSNGNEVATTQNLLGVGAGTYILTVSCDGEEVCTVSETISNFPDLTITETITNAGCGTGSISVNVSGGSGDYSYNWDPAQADAPTISGLDAGNYGLTVTDNVRGCTKTASFEVLNEVSDLEITSSVVVDESCEMGNGRISITVSGGCQPYTFTWSDDATANTPMRDGLTAGNYGVTVTDDSDPELMVIGSYTVEGTDPITLVGSATIVPSSGSNGSITIEVTGGNPDYNYSWSGPTSNLPNSNMITGLMFGDYFVTVTDADGCTAEFGPFNVTEIVDSEPPVVENVGAENNANGFAIVCNGDLTGAISGIISGGLTPLTIELSGDASESITLENLGTFRFDALGAGTYTITVTNSDSSVSFENIEVTEPDAIEVDVEFGCDSEEQCDGFIDLDISGGFGDFTIDWGSADLMGESLDNLCQGTYAYRIEDENGCVFIDSATIESCEGPVDPDCYQVRDVITPNGDGMNDQFTITCINDFPASLEIYDRWGKLVYDQSPYDGSWMGVSNSNEELIEGGYMYIINIDFGQGRREIMKGALTLLRD